MISVYNDMDYVAVHKQRNKIITVFAVITAIYLLFCAAWLIYHTTLPYADPLDALPRTIVYVASAIYMLFAFPYMSIKYNRVNRYYKLFRHFGEAMKIDETYHFYGFREMTLQKDNVDAITCVFAVWDKKKREWLECAVYCDPEKDLPPFERGDLVHYVTQSNFILGYEILEKHAVELDDVFEYEEYDEEISGEEDEEINEPAQESEEKETNE